MTIIRAKAPVRLEFAGGGTDVPPFTDDHGGLIFNATINNYAYCSIQPSKTDDIKIHSLDYNIIARYTSTKKLEFDGNLDLVKAVIKHMDVFRKKDSIGMDIVLHSDVPAGSGLGSSSTVCVALVKAIADYYDVSLWKAEIAKLAYEIERNDLGIAGGLQDQYAASFGGFNLMEFGKNNSVSVRPVHIPTEIKSELLYHLVLINTCGSRLSGDVIVNQTTNYKTNPETVLPYYEKSKEIARDMADALSKGNTHEFGRLLGKAFINKKMFSSKITNDRIDLLYDTGMNNGAIGGRIMGAGGGGHMLFYVMDIVNRKSLISALEAHGAKYVPFSFDSGGVDSWKVKMY